MGNEKNHNGSIKDNGFQPSIEQSGYQPNPRGQFGYHPFRKPESSSQPPAPPTSGTNASKPSSESE